MRRLFPILVLSLLLTSCEQEAPPIATPTYLAPRLPTPVPTSIPPTTLPRTTKTPPLSPPPTETPLPEPFPVATEEQVRIRYLDMIDAQFGWAVFVRGHSKEEQYWLGRTTDGGHTWINVTPPEFRGFRIDTIEEASPLTISPTSTHIRVSGLDPETAWVHFSCNNSSLGCDVPPVTWRTQNGGRSWKMLSVPVDCRAYRTGCIPRYLLFVDRQHGWMNMSLFGRNYLDYDFYRTDDGGVTWVKMPKFELAAGGANYLFDPIFVDANFGWKLAPSYWFATIGEMKDSGLIWSEITRDGGYNWQVLHLPLPLGLLEAATARQIPDTQTVKIEYSFVPMGSNVVRILASMRADDYEPPFFSAYYFSADQGRSWEPLSRSGDTFYLDQETGWRLADLEIMALEQTNNGGVTWVAYPQESISLEWNNGVYSLIQTTGGGAKQIEIPWVFSTDELWPGQALRLESLQMETTISGWGMEVGGNVVCTEDGAHTWEPCQPPEEGVLHTEASLPKTDGYWLPSQPLPHELFHGGAIPSRFQTEIDEESDFPIQFDELGWPHLYRCSSQRTDMFEVGMVGVARRCVIIYPAEYHPEFDPEFGFQEGYWLYYYYVLIDDGESRILPHVVSMDFVDEQAGWRLLDLQNGFFHLEKTEDGGDTWTTVKTVAWTGQLEFVTADVGWSIAREPALRGVPTYLYTPDLFRPVSLLHTVDGGRTWQEFHPVVASLPK